MFEKFFSLQTSQGKRGILAGENLPWHIETGCFGRTSSLEIDANARVSRTGAKFSASTRGFQLKNRLVKALVKARGQP